MSALEMRSLDFLISDTRVQESNQHICTRMRDMLILEMIVCIALQASSEGEEAQ